MSEHFGNILGLALVLFLGGAVVNEYAVSPTVRRWATVIGVLCAGALCAAIVRAI